MSGRGDSLENSLENSHYRGERPFRGLFYALMLSDTPGPERVSFKGPAESD